jgi:predicted dehydrogenase
VNNIILIGLGEIADSHIPAIERMPDAKVVAAVDLKPRELSFRNHTIPVYTSILSAYAEHPADIVVVATSTPSHYDVCREVYALHNPPRRIFIEKPVADNYDKVAQLFQTIPPATKLEPLLHFAYSPEVLWAAKNLAGWISRYGPIINYQGTFDDPRHDPASAAKRAALGNSWIDWGINALSIAQKFITPTHLTVVSTNPGLDYQATFSFRTSGNTRTGTIATNWSAHQPSFRTVITFESGDTLKINHFDVRAELIHEGRLISCFESDGTPRRVSHYINLYADILGANQLGFDQKTALRLHQLLYQQIARPSVI